MESVGCTSYRFPPGGSDFAFGTIHPFIDESGGIISILKRYVAQTADGMQTGMFTYLAHPDLMYFTGSDRDYRDQMRILAREAKSCNMPLEINLMGKWANRNYPDIRFWELAAEEGCMEENRKMFRISSITCHSCHFFGIVL